MADNLELMNEARDRVAETFNSGCLKPLQREALEKLVSGQDVFVIQPTGSVKSPISQSASIVFDKVKHLTNPKPRSITIVISPLVSLMEDYIDFLNPLDGAVALGEIFDASEGTPRFINLLLDQNFSFIQKSRFFAFSLNFSKRWTSR